MKYSIIIPVYNVEKYIEKCLKSIQNQTHKEFQVIIVNDGSPDNSQTLINALIKNDERFISVYKKNGGLSDARNYGLQYVEGDYILFVDGDDFVEPEWLEQLDRAIKQNPNVDLIRYGVRATDEFGQELRIYKNHAFEYKKIEDAISLIMRCELVEPAWQYAYRSEFFIENKFMYPKGKIHEDFGLTPLILAKAKDIISLDYIAINYVQRESSIMQQVTPEKRIKRFEDMVYHYKYLVFEVEKLTNIHPDVKKMLLSFISNGVILRFYELEKTDRDNYKKTLSGLQVAKNMLDDSWIRKLKKLYYSCVFK